jgi:hypothetical protein
MNATTHSTADGLVGTFRTFGEYGPAYQVVGTFNGQKVHVVVLQTGEELDYPTEQAVKDPKVS